MWINRKDVSKKNIKEAVDNELHDSTLFGVPLEIAAKRSDPKGETFPSPLKLGIEWLNKKGLEEEGLYRIPGSREKYNKYREAFDNGDDVNLDDEYIPENVTLIVTKFLCNIPGGILTRELYPKFEAVVRRIQDADSFEEQENAKSSLMDLIKMLPYVHRENLNYFVNHCRLISERSEINQMSPDILAMTFSIIFGSTFGMLIQILVLSPELLYSTIIFGCSIETAAQRSGGLIPLPILYCVTFLNTCKKGALEEIYQAVGNYEDINEWIRRFNRGEVIEPLPLDLDPDTASGIIKVYVNSLPKGLFPPEYRDTIRSVAKFDSKEEVIDELRDVLVKMSPELQATLGMMCKHFNNIVTTIEKQSPFILSAVFGSHYIDLLAPWIENATEIFE